jgi:hypothetical protein
MARAGQHAASGDRLVERIGIGVLTSVFTPELVDRMVDQVGVRERRSRALPSQVIVYYVLAMVLFFHSSYTEVWDKLAAGLEWAGCSGRRIRSGGTPTAAAITYARQRLGWQVMEALLDEVVRPRQRDSASPGMRLVAVDDVCLDLPETEENAAEFGGSGGDASRGSIPRVRVVAAGECVTRAVLAAELSPLSTGEQALIGKLLARLAPDDLLVIDRDRLSHDVVRDVVAAGMHVLWRVSGDADLPVVEVLADGTYRSRLADRGIPVRILEYTPTSAGDHPARRVALCTDVLEPQVLGLEQAGAAYASRWQLKTCLNRLETSLSGDSTVVLRSKSPHLIRQEIYAMLCCYEAIRVLMSDFNLTLQ